MKGYDKITSYLSLDLMSLIFQKVASNLSTSSEEEELTREILALFDYDDESEIVGNETLQINETNCEEK